MQVYYSLGKQIKYTISFDPHNSQKWKTERYLMKLLVKADTLCNNVEIHSSL